MCQKAVGGCLYIWKNNYGAIKTTLSNKHGHVENAYVIWNTLTNRRTIFQEAKMWVLIWFCALNNLEGELKRKNINKGNGW